MRISDLIEELEDMRAKYGDVECKTIISDEDGDFVEPYFGVSVFYIDCCGDIYAECELSEGALESDDFRPVLVL